MSAVVVDLFTKRVLNKPLHKYAIGDLVEVKYDSWYGAGACEKVHARLYVVSSQVDMDGFPSYNLSMYPATFWKSRGFEPEKYYDGQTYTKEEMNYIALAFRVVSNVPETLIVQAVECTQKVLAGSGALLWDLENKNDSKRK